MDSNIPDTLTLEKIRQAQSVYRLWLMEQDLSQHTKRAYWSCVQHFLEFIEYSHKKSDGDQEFEGLVRKYRDFLKFTMKVGAASINNSLFAIDHFCRAVGLREANVEREKRRRSLPKVLTVEQQQMFLKSVWRQESARDRALAMVLLSTGLRVGECAALNVDDISCQDNRLILTLKRAGARGRRVKELSFTGEEEVEAIRQWLYERLGQAIDEQDPALWVGRHGKRLSIAGIDFIVRRIGWQAHLVVSAEILRQTGLANIAGKLRKDELALHLGGHTTPAEIARFRSTAGAENLMDMICDFKKE